VVSTGVQRVAYFKIPQAEVIVVYKRVPPSLLLLGLALTFASNPNMTSLVSEVKTKPPDEIE
jgi:hypothetical protein